MPLLSHYRTGTLLIKIIRLKFVIPFSQEKSGKGKKFRGGNEGGRGRNRKEEGENQGEEKLGGGGKLKHPEVHSNEYHSLCNWMIIGHCDDLISTL